MHELANELIQQIKEEIIDEWDFEIRKNKNPNKIKEKIVESWDFEVRRKKYPSKCPYYTYTNGEKCHNMEKLNCLTCLCPNYDRTIKEGGCIINSPDAKYAERLDGKILDCSDCEFPHKRENAIKFLENLFK